MKKEIKIDQKAVLLDFLRRVADNENGVKGYLEKAGIESGQNVTIGNLQQLRSVNPDGFKDMISFLYPESKHASAMGDFMLSDITALLGTVLTGSTGILSMLNINGNTSAQAAAQAAAAMAEVERSNAEKKQMRKTIIIVCVGFIILAVAGIFIFRSRR